MDDSQTTQMREATSRRTAVGLFERHEFSRMFSAAPAEEINAALRRLSPGEAFKAISFMNSGCDEFLFRQPEKTRLVVPVLLEAIGLDIAHAERENRKVSLGIALDGIKAMEARQQRRMRNRESRLIPYSEIRRLIGKAESAILSLQSFQKEGFPSRGKTGAHAGITFWKKIKA